MTTFDRRGRRPKHQWGTSGQTRRSLLDAARSVFGRHGFAAASVAEIVEAADSSVGSMYHHFGGKAELFVALWVDYSSSLGDLVQAALADASERGVDDPWERYLVAVRVHLDDAWTRRDLVRLFGDGDAPAGFSEEMLAHQRKVFAVPAATPAGGDAVGRLVSLTFTSLLSEACREIAAAPSPTDAVALADGVIELLARLRPIVTT